MLPLDKNNLFSDVIINQWAPQIKDSLPSFRGKLLQDNGVPHPDLLRVIDAVDRHFLFPGYQDYFRSLMCREKVVFSHCDAHEYNILAMRRDATKTMLIDFEYCGWQPRAFDLANYLNEVAFDNVYPYKKGIALYTQNLMGEAEIRDFLTQYLRHEHKHLAVGDVNVDDYIKTELPKLTEEVHKNILLNNWCWGIWALKMLKPADVTSETVFNYDFADLRVQLYLHQKKLLNI